MAKKQTKSQIAKPAIQNKAIIQMPKEAKGKLSMHIKLAICLGVISLIIYANTLRNGFTLDDASAVTENKFVAKGISAIHEILFTPYHRGYLATSNDLYRPLSLVIFAVEHQFFGVNPLVYHFFNIILFACCVILLFLFLDKLFERKKTVVAFIASLLFAVHPIHTEVVANIKSCDELLCFFFTFLCLNMFIKYVQTGKITLLIAGFFLFLLSLLSKETVITFLAVVPLIFFFYRNENKKRSAYIFVSTVFATIIFLAMRFSVLNYYYANDLTNISFIDNILAKPGLTYESRIATAILILGYYIKLLFIPYPLVCDYSYNTIPFVHFSDPRVLLSLAIYAFLIFFSIQRFRKNSKDSFAFGILFSLITITLFSNIPFLIGTPMGERLLFFPSIGFCLIIALLIEKWVVRSELNYQSLLKNTFLKVLLLPVIIIFTSLTITRNNDWKDDYTLYKTDLRKSLNNSRLNNYYGNEIVKNALTEKDTSNKRQIIMQGIPYIKNAISIYPDYRDAVTNMGRAYFSISYYDSAERYFFMAYLLTDSNGMVEIKNLANVYMEEKKYTQAIKLFKKAIEINPNDDDAYGQLAVSYFNISKYDTSEVYCIKALNLNPENMPAIDHLAGIYYIKNDYAKAISIFKKTIELNPGNIRPYTNISVCYLNLGKNDSAIYYLNKAISIDPTAKRSYELLSKAYKAAGNLELSNKYETIAQQK